MDEKDCEVGCVKVCCVWEEWTEKCLGICLRTEGDKKKKSVLLLCRVNLDRINNDELLNVNSNANVREKPTFLVFFFWIM